MLANFEFYSTIYHGILITSENDYLYFAERAGDELARFVDRVIKTEEGQRALQRCACRVADILYGQYKTSKFGTSGKISSESISGYYSVSYGTTTDKEIAQQINNTVALYLGRYLIGGAKVII